MTKGNGIGVRQPAQKGDSVLSAISKGSDSSRIAPVSFGERGPRVDSPMATTQPRHTIGDRIAQSNHGAATAERPGTSRPNLRQTVEASRPPEPPSRGWTRSLEEIIAFYETDRDGRRQDISQIQSIFAEFIDS
jgi:hypothetical protein